MCYRIAPPALVDQHVVEHLLIEHDLLPRRTRSYLTGDRVVDAAKETLFDFCELVYVSGAR